MKQWFRTFISYNQNLYAMIFSTAVLLVLLGFLWLMPRAGIIDYGQNDQYLRELGLGRTAADQENPQERYYVKVIEEYTVEKIPAAGLLQFTPSRSVVYPSVIVSLFSFLFGGTYSTVCLAVVLSVWISVSVFFLIKALYSYLERFTVPAGVLMLLVILSSSYAVPLNCLDGGGTFLASFIFVLAMGLKAWNYTGERPAGMLGSLGAACFMLVLSQENAVVLFPAAGALLIAAAWRLSADSGRKRRLMAAAVMGTALMGLCSWRLMSEYKMTQEANLYQAAFCGALQYADDPQEAVEWFGLEPELAQDVGRSYYEAEENFVVCPRDEENKSRIFDHLSYGRLFMYYLSHPGALGGMLQAVWEKTAGLNTQTMLYVGEKTTQPHAQVTNLDLWQYIRTLIYPQKLWAFLAAAAAAAAAAVWLWVRRKNVLGLMYLFGIAFWGAAMVQAFWFTGTANLYRSIYAAQLLTDFLLIGAVSAGVRLIVRAFEYIAYPRVKRRPRPAEPEADWVALDIPAVQEGKKWIQDKARRFRQKLREQPGKLDWIFLAAGAAVLIWVLFFPRIGAHNNGDYGRMLDAMGIRYNDEDWAKPEEQVIKVIEDYVYLEPYDYLHVLPPNAELSQAYVSGFMRVLYVLTGLPFSTIYVTVLYAAVILAGFFWLLRLLRVTVGRQICWIGPLLLVMLFGSGNLVWLNSLFGEGVAFVGLMAVLGCSGYILCQERRKPRWSLLLLAFSILFFGTAKAQYVLSLPVLLIWWGCLFFYHQPQKIWKKCFYFTAGAAGVLIIAMSALHAYQVNNVKSSPDNIYQSLFYGILMIVDDPEETLEELGLDPALAADTGKHASLDKSEYFCPPRTEKAEEMLYSKVSVFDFVFWYLKHPDKLWYMMDVTAKAASDPMPDYGLYVGEKTTDSPRTVSKMNLWYEIRQQFALNQFWQYVLFYGVLMGWSVSRIASSKTQSRIKWLYGLYLTIMLTGIIQFPMTVIGNGFADNIKQLYIFRVTYDITLVIAIYLAAKGIAGLRKRMGKEGKSHADSKELVQ